MNDRPISSIWDDVKPDDIGGGFRSVNRNRDGSKTRKSKKPSTRKERLERARHDVKTVMSELDFVRMTQKESPSYSKHKFITGKSRFIFWLFKEPVFKKVPKKKVDEQPVNAKVKLTKRDKESFASSLKANIQRNTDFYWKEILPLSLSVVSAVKDTDERLQQLLDVKAGLPVDFIKNKTRDAIYFRIIRHICEMYGLTQKEREMMVVEYTSKRISF